VLENLFDEPRAKIKNDVISHVLVEITETHEHDDAFRDEDHDKPNKGKQKTLRGKHDHLPDHRLQDERELDVTHHLQE